MNNLDFRKLSLVIGIAFVCAGILACEIPGMVEKPTKPTVVINSPHSGARVKVGEEAEVRSTATDEKGVARVELWVDGALVGSDQSPIPQPAFPLVQRWTPDTAGSHTVEVRAYNVDDVVSEPAMVIVEAVVGVATATPAPPTPTLLTKEWKISPDKYVFIDHHVHKHGELVEGDYMGPMIDFPTYEFDEETNTLKGWIDFEISEELKVVYGSGASLSGVAGGGAATRLVGVYELPYERNGFKIEIEPDGTAHIEYKNFSIILKSGEEWVNITSEIDAQQFGDQIGKAKLTITDTIVNYGILDKSKIEER